MLLIFIHSFLTHFIVTLPGTLRYGPSHLYDRFLNFNTPPITCYSTSVNPDSELIVFVHGRNGHPNCFIPLIENLKKFNVTKQMVGVNLGPTADTSIINDSAILYKILEPY